MVEKIGQMKTHKVTLYSFNEILNKLYTPDHVRPFIYLLLDLFIAFSFKLPKKLTSVNRLAKIGISHKGVQS
jgi:hypothetical protein